MEINRDFFDGYAERIAVDDFFSVLDEGKSSLNLSMLLKARIRQYVEGGSLIVKEFELDLYRSEDNRYVVHICRLDGSTNYCDYYIIERLTGAIKYRIFRALVLEALDASDIKCETGEDTQEIDDLLYLLKQAQDLMSSQSQ